MEETPKTALESVNYDGREVKLCEDGKYRWTYPYHMLKNPTIIATILKIFGGIFLAGFLIYIIATLKNGHADRILADLKWWGVAILVFLVLLAISYFIVAAMYGFKYIVKFTMDENGVLHEQIPEQAKKAKKLGAVVAAAGAIGGNIGLRDGEFGRRAALSDKADPVSRLPVGADADTGIVNCDGTGFGLIPVNYSQDGMAFRGKVIHVFTDTPCQRGQDHE